MANKRKDSNKATGRDYSKDKSYENSPTQIKNREERNLARAHALHSVAKTHNLTPAQAKKKMHDKDVDHKKSLKGGGSNLKKNTRWRSIHSNRGDKTF